MKKVFCVVALSIISCLPICASAATTPEVLSSGFTAYKESGAKSALEAWIKGSGIEGSIRHAGMEDRALVLLERHVEGVVELHEVDLGNDVEGGHGWILAGRTIC